RFHLPEGYAGRRALKGRGRARGRHHDPGLPHHLAGTVEIRFWGGATHARPAARGRANAIAVERVCTTQYCVAHRGVRHHVPALRAQLRALSPAVGWFYSTPCVIYQGWK